MSGGCAAFCVRRFSRADDDLLDVANDKLDFPRFRELNNVLGSYT
jgi:hypothetical protein